MDMNIIKMRQEERIAKISSIKKSILKAETIDYNRLLMKCCSTWGMSTRVVSEYIKIAKFELDIV